MRISKQVSGNTATPDDAKSQGRGEYEWADLLPGDPTRQELLNCRILLRLPDDVVLDTACEFESQGNKWRIRTVAGSQGACHTHPVYHLAVALLMPCPTRQEQNMGSGLPVLRSDEYSMCDIIAEHVPVPAKLAGAITSVSGGRIKLRRGDSTQLKKSGNIPAQQRWCVE